MNYASFASCRSVLNFGPTEWNLEIEVEIKKVVKHLPPPSNASFIGKEHSEVKISAENVPEGCRFKGYQNFIVQDIGLVAKEITYRLEVWQTPDGQIIRAKLPEELNGQHFGPTLKAFITSMYAHGVTQPAIHDFLLGLGFEISTGTINDIMLNEAEQYSAVSEAILTTGLQEAPFFRADDTGAKHKQKAGYCTHIGGEFFAYYKTTFSKSRENFLQILLQGKQGYVINEAMIWHLFQCGVSDNILNLFEEHQGKTYRALKQATSEQQGKGQVHELYNQLVAMKTTSTEINKVIGNFASDRDELLR